MKKRKFFALVAVACLAMVMLFKVESSHAQAWLAPALGAVEKIVDVFKREPGEVICRCKKNSEDIKGCYGGNKLSFRANCSYKNYRCSELHTECVN